MSTRFLAVLSTVFGLLGLALGAIGIYGVASQSVLRRSPEFGVRFALGATRGEVVASAVRTGLTPVVLGALGGLAASRAGAGWIGRYLYDVQPSDPLAYASVVLALGIVAAAALAVPAWRAGRVDPARVLAE